MPRGGSRPGAGRPRKPLALHQLHGTWRPSRHGNRPTTLLALQAPATAKAWAPRPEELATVTPEGRVFLADLLARYEGFSAVEGRLLIEAAQCVGALAALRTLERDAKTARLEQGWIRLLASLLGQLRVEEP